MNTFTESHQLDTLVHYICARCDNPSKLGVTKLNKILWYSDVLYYAEHGSSITGAVYVKRQYGPVPKDIMQARQRLKNSGKILEREALYHSFNQIHMIALERPDISVFSAEQISLVDSVLETICSGFTASSISELSHDIVWEAAAIGEEIPMHVAAFAGNIGEINEDDIEWANNEIDRIEREKLSS